MPLSTLIEQNSDAIDVNFISQNNFSNNAYRGNFNPKPFPSNSSNNYGNPYNLLIRLQRIYNFLLFHAIILSVLDVLYALICYFI